MNDLNTDKLWAITVMLVLALSAGLLPILLRKYIINSRRISEKMAMIILSASLCFGAGVLMATVFLHILVEARENFLELQNEGYIPETDYPFPELMICTGFFLIYFIEEMVHVWAHKQEELSNPKDHDILETYSRRGSLCPKVRTPKCRRGSKPDVQIKVFTVREGHVNNDFEIGLAQENDQVGEKTTAKELVPNGNHLAMAGTALRNTVPATPTEAEKADKYGSLVKSILVVLALSIHGVFEGMALGLEDEVYNVWLMCAALSTHKIFIGFSIAMELLETDIHKSLFVFNMVIFSIASPIGAIIGALLSTASNIGAAGDIATVVLQCLSGGTIIYITFCEILERERSKVSGKFIRLVALMAGFATIATLEFVEHSEEHDHNIDNITNTIRSDLYYDEYAEDLHYHLH